MAPPARRRLSSGALVTVTVLLAVPLLAILLVPIYARKGPELWGFPFFYWYQLLWTIVSGLFTLAAYRVIERDRRRGNR